MINFLKGLCGAVPWKASLLTWEWTTTYEKCPVEKDLRNSFGNDFPETVARLRGGFYLLWPLVSFNSPEGRRYRYLVALVNESNPEGRGRFLPSQIWLYGVADRMLRGADKKALDASLNGNALFYYWENESLYVLIFYEGRLCHWIEESGYENAGLVEKRLESLKEFLRKDSLFSRCDHYDFIQIDSSLWCGDWCRRFFKTASKDPFWINLNLFSGPMERHQKKYRLGLWSLCILLLFVMGLWIHKVSESDKEKFFEDVLPPELTVPSLVQNAEPRNSFDASAPGDLKDSCLVDDLRIQGTVGDRLFLAEGKTFEVGSRLGHFLVHKIDGYGVEFSCGGSVYFVEVR